MGTLTKKLLRAAAGVAALTPVGPAMLRWAALVGLFTALFVATGSPAHAEDDIEINGKCVGTKIRRCVHLHWDIPNKRYRVHAGMLDVPDDYTYLINILSTSWTSINTSQTVVTTDPDGPFAGGDTAVSGYGLCAAPTQVFFRAVFEWAGEGEHKQEKVESWARICRTNDIGG
ncbi:hypothetical protein OHA25_60260 (plasmid) [Nonomuraea sp. NBC_00507]|uniref:hypothetical protein n=1 Tax=Nonomuraea sp. NBC_00507 TaxID=2976002 RepID=UPI002E175A46